MASVRAAASAVWSPVWARIYPRLQLLTLKFVGGGEFWNQSHERFAAIAPARRV